MVCIKAAQSSFSKLITCYGMMACTTTKFLQPEDLRAIELERPCISRCTAQLPTMLSSIEQDAITAHVMVDIPGQTRKFHLTKVRYRAFSDQTDFDFLVKQNQPHVLVGSLALHAIISTPQSQKERANRGDLLCTRSGLRGFQVHWYITVVFCSLTPVQTLTQRKHRLDRCHCSRRRVVSELSSWTALSLGDPGHCLDCLSGKASRPGPWWQSHLWLVHAAKS